MYLYRTRKLQVGGKTTGPQPFSVPVAKPTNVGVPAGKVRYGTTEYDTAWKAGQVQNPSAIKGPNPTYWGGQLSGVTIHGKPREKGTKDFLIQYKNKIIEDHKNDGIIGATVGTPIDAIVSLPQRAVTYAATGKAGVPSDFLGFSAESKGGWRDSPTSFAKNLYNLTVDTVTDPMNIVGAGLLTKEEVVSNILNKGAARNMVKKVGVRTAEMAMDKVPERAAHEQVIVGEPLEEHMAPATPVTRAIVMKAVTPQRYRSVSTRATDVNTGSNRAIAMVSPPVSQNGYGVFGRGGLLYK